MSSGQHLQCIFDISTHQSSSWHIVIIKKLLAIYVNQDYHTTIVIISFCLVYRLALSSFLFLLHQRFSVFACSFPSPCLCLASHSHFLSSAIHAGVYYWRKTQGCLEFQLSSVSCHICLSFLSWSLSFPLVVIAGFLFYSEISLMALCSHCPDMIGLLFYSIKLKQIPDNLLSLSLFKEKFTYLWTQGHFLFSLWWWKVTFLAWKP